MRLLFWNRSRLPGDRTRPCAEIASAGPPIFISGCNRGGTSILSLLLGHHPEVCNVGTGPFHEGQHIWRQRFRDRSHHRWAVEPWVRQMRKTAADATPELIAYFRSAFAAVSGSGRMLEKTPANAVRIPFINRIYPDCYVIHIVRDGRATVASLMARKVTLPDAARQWVGVHTIALPDVATLGERGLVICYEELTGNPMAALLKVCRHCCLDTGAASRRALEQAVAQYLTSPQNRWAVLRDTERRRILEIIGELQAKLGYPVDL